MSASARPPRRWIAALMALLTGLGPIATPSYAALTKLADEPLNVKNSAKPNIVLTIDDSTSMLYDFLPDYVIGTYEPDPNTNAPKLVGDALCRDGSGKRGAPCGQVDWTYDLSSIGHGKYFAPAYIWQQYGRPYKDFSAAFDTSGPGSGCSIAKSPNDRCSGAIDPTVGGTDKIGLKTYPPLWTSTSPVAGLPFEYWLLWPAPAHNSAVNYLYYNPSLTYEPPAYSDGKPFPTMNASNTGNWTAVPPDPWSTTLPLPTVDLTATVTVGQWCNSDWTLSDSTGSPFVKDASHCRTNGTVDDKAVPGADGDYTYPWLWKPDLTDGTRAPLVANDPLSKVTAASPTYTLKPAWTDFQKVTDASKYFYQNDNVIWCDITSPAWPRTTTTGSQTCTLPPVPTCTGGSTGTCTTPTAPTCLAGTAQTCNGLTTQTCSGTQPSCSPVSQTCSTGTQQTCGSFTQTCSATTYACNVPSNTCQVNSASCTIVYGPAGCGTAESPPCIPTTDCKSKCSYTGIDCTSDPTVCTTPAGTCATIGGSCTAATAATACFKPGTCNLKGQGCKSNAECPIVNACGSSTGATCTVSPNSCPFTGRTCNITGASCTGSCPTVNRCGGVATGAACTTSPNNCAIVGGKCSKTGTACTSNAQCAATGTGTCSVTGVACSSTSPCANTNRKCDSNASNAGAACTSNANCTAKPKFCSNNTSKTCSVSSDCTVSGLCDSNAQNAGTVCSSASTCTRKAGTCTATATSCTTNADCKDSLPVANATCSTTGVGGVSTASLFADAEGAGVVCRHNNKTYADMTAGRNTYPDAKYTVPITGGTGATACVASPRYANVPRHYWKTAVEWCQGAIGDSNDKWAGYGEAGSCQSFRDDGHRLPRFHKYGTAAGTDNYGTPAFERVDLDIAKRATAKFSYLDTDGVVQQRTFDEEMTNYANWFAYYRNRIQAVKTVTSLTFKELDNTYRVGLHTLSNEDDRAFVNVADFDSAQKKAWFDRLFGLTINLGQETPNLDAIIRVGEYYKTGNGGALKSATDPIVLSCQKNWHMLFTDGLTNQDTPTLSLADQDNTVPTLPRDVLGLTPSQPWPPLFHENATASINSAADYITHYWVTDFRAEGAVNGTTKASVGLDNVPVSDADPASWQHQNFAAMSLGTQGKLPSGNQSGTEKSLARGDIAWPETLPSTNQPDESGVDDLWHAAINGRGRFVNAQSADELRLGMGQILQDIANQAGSRAGVAFQNVNLSATNKYIYRVGFEPGWGGTLMKVEVDPFTGNEVGKEVWSAAKQLNDQVAVTAEAKEPWYTNRKIATMSSSGTPMPFLWASLSGAQQNSLSQRSALEAANATRGKAVLEFLRGSQLKEGLKLNQFRERKTVLGDIADSQAIFTGPPKAPYLDSNDPGYSTFKDKYAARPARLFVGANDGMVHAFDEETGNEAWAYVPLGIYRTGSTGPGALSLQTGALPAFQHHFYVDSSPRVVDADLGSGDWRSVMVGGLGKGGRSYYAIDVTNPASVVDEISLAKNVLWEFSDPDMGYSYGRPMITKTRGFGGKWLAIVPTGYNNASGEGKVFFIDLKDGSLLKTMSTGAGDSATPSGLAHIAGYTRDYRNQLTEQVYAGDLLGNLWRFDVSDPDPSLWKVEQLATLTDPSGVRQPVTTPPQIEVDVVNGVDRWVFVGTGKLYHNDDLKDTQIQTMYAIRDGTTTLPAKITSVVTRANLDEITDAKGVTGLDGKPDVGWFDDLPSGQRIVVPPQAALSVVTYSAVLPQDDPCLTGQPSRVYARGYERGDSLVLDENGVLTESIGSSEGAVGVELLSLGSASQDDGSVPNIVIGVTLGTTGKLRTFKLQPPIFMTAHRMSWRLLGN